MMVRHYSHEAADLQPALEMLKGQNMEDHEVCVYSCAYCYIILVLFYNAP